MSFMPNLIGLSPTDTKFYRIDSSTDDIQMPKGANVKEEVKCQKLPSVKKRIRKNSKATMEAKINIPSHGINPKIVGPMQNQAQEPLPQQKCIYRPHTSVETKWLRSSLPIEAIIHLIIYTRMTEYPIIERIQAANELLRNHSGLVKYLVQQTDREMLQHLKFFRELGELLKEMNY